MTAPIRLPYFDTLLALLAEGNAAVQQSFGTHVHWGYWRDPARADLSLEGFAAATEALSGLVVEAAQVRSGMAVLDAGCGFGGTTSSINARHTDMQLVGLNIDARQLARAATLTQSRPGNTLSWMQADACVLPFADNSFDAVLAVECIFHFGSRERFFREAYRVLKPGGHLALSDFVPKASCKPLLRLLSRRPANAGFYGRCAVDHSLADYRLLAQRTGFCLDHEEDITANTLPTYPVLRSLVRGSRWPGLAAVTETLALEGASRLGALRYWVLGLEKPQGN